MKSLVSSTQTASRTIETIAGRETVPPCNFAPAKEWRFKYPSGEWRQERIPVDDIRRMAKIWQLLTFSERLELRVSGIEKLEKRGIFDAE